MRLFVVTCLFAFSALGLAQTHSSYVSRLIRSQAPQTCLKQGEGANDQGLGGMGGCSDDSECCAGLSCERTSNDFWTCEAPWDGKPTPPTQPSNPDDGTTGGFCADVGTGGCAGDYQCCTGFSCQRVTNDFFDCIKN